jgi:hypothetical protein
MTSNPYGMVGEGCSDDIGRVTCGDGEWCLQVMDQNDGDGTCVAFCDPTTLGACPMGEVCTEIGVAAGVPTSPVIHVCQVAGSDSGIPVVGLDSGGGGGGGFDAGLEGGGGRLLFDGGPLP